MSDKMTIGFTGRRKLNGRDYYVREALRIAFHKALKAGYTEFISGGALGSDWIFSELIVKYNEMYSPGVTLIQAIPFWGYNDRWPSELISKFEDEILAKATEVKAVSEHYHPLAFTSRNKYIVDHSQAMISVWEGLETGGTHMAISYAKKTGIPVFNVDPVFKQACWIS